MQLTRSAIPSLLMCYFMQSFICYISILHEVIDRKLFLCPLLKKAGYIALHMSVGRYVGTSVTFSLPLYNLVMHGGILK